MNKILVEVSVGELLDKISILEIKKEKITDPESTKFIEKEYLILKNQLDKNIKYDEKLDELFNKLKKINMTLWGIEDEKRSKDLNYRKRFEKGLIEGRYTKCKKRPFNQEFQRLKTAEQEKLSV